MKWLLFLTLSVLFYVLILLFTARRHAMETRMTSFITNRARTDLQKGTQKPQTARRLRTVLRSFSQKWGKGRGTKHWESTQNKLNQAGNPTNLTAAEWVGLRLFLTLLAFGLGTVVSIWVQGLRGLLILLACVLLGWIGPDFWLSRRVTQRQQEISRQLPSALDLLTVSVEAGLGFDQALARVAQKLQGALAEEFARCIREIQLGTARAASLEGMAARTGVDALKSFASAIIQADKLGTGLTQVLRIQSTSLRETRRLEAQERAMKAPVKMLFPLVLFVFPAVFVVILGPAILHVISLFSHGGV